MLVTVAAYTNAIEAQITKGRFEAEGIPTFIVNENYVWANWAMSQALGGVQLQVPEQYAEAALAVVESINDGDYQTELEDISPAEEKLCSRCSAKATQVDGLRRWALLFNLLQIIPGLIFPFTRHLWRCNTCGRVWVASEDRSYSLTALFALGILFVMIISLPIMFAEDIVNIVASGFGKLHGVLGFLIMK